MKAIKFLLKSILILGLLSMSPIICLAQFSIKEVLNLTPTEALPFSAKKNTKFLIDKNYGVDNSNNVISDKLYDNVQLTQYVSASASPDLGAMFFRKFNIPGSANLLVAVAFGAASDWQTIVLCVVTSSGTVLSTLEGRVLFSYIAIKQFRVTAQGKIIITTIKPVSSVSIPFETFTSFIGQRIDTTYSVNAQGQFVRESEKLYKPKTYLASYMDDKNHDLWDGGETTL